MRALRAAALGTLVALAAVAQGSAHRTVWDGVYTGGQSARGQAAYSQHCRQCHGADLGGYQSTLKGNTFMLHWTEDSLHNVYAVMRSTMPRGKPGSLPDAAYLDILAYILEVNGFPQGAQELAPDALGDILVQAKSGPAPLPTGALVDLIGCLQPGPGKSWTVANASEPVRTRNPSDSSMDELRAWDAKPLGGNTFTLMDAEAFNPDPLKGVKVEVKGFLIRKPGDDKINLTLSR